MIFSEDERNGGVPAGQATVNIQPFLAARWTSQDIITMSVYLRNRVVPRKFSLSTTFKTGLADRMTTGAVQLNANLK